MFLSPLFAVCRGAFRRPGFARAAFLSALMTVAASAAPAEDPLLALLSAARDACRRSPNSVTNLDWLAALELRRYRITHAAETLQSAQTTIDRTLTIDPTDFDARRFRISIMLTNHAFADVEREALRLSAERPRDIDVIGMIADAQMETGRYDEAVATIQRMVNTRPGLPSYSRVAYAREICGDLKGALAAMDMAIAAGDPSDPEGVSWCIARSGMLCWKLGSLHQAARRFEAARDLFPRSPYAWEGIGLIASSRGDFTCAANAFEHAFQIVPWPQYAVERAEMAMALGRSGDARRWKEIVRAIERISTDGGLFSRVLAMYEADYGDPAKAVVMAQSELAARKDVYGWDAYAWALHRSGRAREAADAARHAVSRGTQDPMLDAHAGMIFAASEEPEQARLYLARALTANPHFHVFRAEEARAQGARPAP